MTETQPSDLHLTERERLAILAEHIRCQEATTGEPGADIYQRLMGTEDSPGLGAHLMRMKVVRESHAHLLDEKPATTPKQAQTASALARSLPYHTRAVIDDGEYVVTPALAQIRQWHRSIKGPKRLGLLLFGGAAQGKTLHACLLLHGSHLATEKRARFVSESDLVTALQARPGPDRDLKLRPLRDASFLVVDHMGGGKPWAPSKWVHGLVEFLRLRFERGDRTVLTFRGSLGDFKTTYRPEAWATFERFTTWVEVSKPLQVT